MVQSEKTRSVRWDCDFLTLDLLLLASYKQYRPKRPDQSGGIATKDSGPTRIPTTSAMSSEDQISQVGLRLLGKLVLQI